MSSRDSARLSQPAIQHYFQAQLVRQLVLAPIEPALLPLAASGTGGGVGWGGVRSAELGAGVTIVRHWGARLRTCESTVKIWFAKDISSSVLVETDI